jgi:hypothetical protein
MADTTDPKQQQPRPRGIAAAAIEGAREGERNVDPDEVTGSLARPAPGMTEQPEPSPSSTNQYTGVTGGLTDAQDDEDQQWRRAGGAGGAGGAGTDGERAGGGNPDAADEPLER